MVIGESKKVEEKKQRDAKAIRYFLVDLGFEEGSQFCRFLLDTGDFSHGLLRSFAPKGSKGLSKGQLSIELASLLLDNRIDAQEFVLAYCRQPRQWLSVRSGSKGHAWPSRLSAKDFLTKREKSGGTSWYGPFGDGAERWYIATRDVKHYSAEEGQILAPHRVRWQVVAQVNSEFAALHWNGFTHRSEDANEGFKQYPYWRDIPAFFRELADIVDGDWNAEEPNLAEVILHGSLGRYADSLEHKWTHKRIRASYQAVAVNASGGAIHGGTTEEELAATGLQILTSALAKTAVNALGRASDEVALRKVERALLLKILHDWGTKSYEFILRSNQGDRVEEGDEDAYAADEIAEFQLPEEPSNGRVRMHIYFGADAEIVGSTTQDSLQHVHCFADYGGSTAALVFILRESEKEPFE